MANEVKWIKLATDMFDDAKIKQLRSMPDGNNIILLWVMLLALAGKCNAGGMIIISENIPYTVDSLAIETGIPKSTVMIGLKALERFNMICQEEGCFVISNWYKHQNQDGLEKIREDNRKRVAKYREKKKELLIEEKEECNVTVTLQETLPSYSISSSLSNTVSVSIKEIIDYLNIVTNSNYKYTTRKTVDCIKARFNEGFTVEDFKTVIDKKCGQWLKDEKMAQYCRPETLFGNKFEGYLNEKIIEREDVKPKSVLDIIANA